MKEIHDNLYANLSTTARRANPYYNLSASLEDNLSANLFENLYANLGRDLNPSLTNIL